SDSAGGPARPYSAWRTLLPTTWAPLSVDGGELGPGLGVAVGGQDVVERNTWGALVQVYTETGRADAALGWIWRGLGTPQLGFSAVQDWDVLARSFLGPDDEVINTALLERERAASAVATFPRPRFRSFSWLSAGVSVRDRSRELAEPDSAPGLALLDPPLDAGAALTAGISTARAYEYSISAEDGVLAAVGVEGRRWLSTPEGFAGARGYFRVAGRGQGYRGLRLGGFARHAVAARVLGGADFGSLSPGYSVGGYGGFAAGYPLSTSAGLGSELDLPVRGYDSGSQFGDRGVAATAEYRFPLTMVERGLGIHPLWLDRLWGAFFADVGTAWCVEACEPALGFNDEPDPLRSVGAELGIDLSVGYFAPIAVRAGVAYPLDEVPLAGGGAVRREVRGYLLAGRSF
ncbi:MAG TPA: hypothetical protein VFX98_02595, partial [Longimicrobiaceae bacterium]|nr:hypothetical protein [Longimicrobiaceae bacterium]